MDPKLRSNPDRPIPPRSRPPVAVTPTWTAYQDRLTEIFDLISKQSEGVECSITLLTKAIEVLSIEQTALTRLLLREGTISEADLGELSLQRATEIRDEWLKHLGG